MSEADDKAPERLRKLRDLAEHPNTPPNEAAAARIALERLMKRYGMSAEDLSSEALIWWTVTVPKNLRCLWGAIAGMILDKPRIAIRRERTDKKTETFRFEAQHVDYADVSACFGYYLKVHHKSLRTISRDAAAARAVIKQQKEKVKLLTRSRRKLEREMIYKYEICPPSVLAAARARAAAAVEPCQTPPKQKRLSKKKLAALQKEWEAEAAAARSLTSGKWEKPEGNIDGEGQRQLGSGEPEFRLEA